MLPTALPVLPRERDDWVLSRRPPRNSLDLLRAYAALVEPEVGPSGLEEPVATVFLTNRECPFRCVMCDLWRNTLPDPTPLSAIPEQVRRALAELPPARHLKLYNAGSFFDPLAIPPTDYEEIAGLCAPFERVIVECHPAFIGPRALRFRELLQEHGTRLEVAVGLETVHVGVLERLNKRMTVADFRRTAKFLSRNEMALRVFLLVRPPWLSENAGIEWACRSLDVAWEAGAEVCCLIPTRAGNGAMEALRETGEWSPPTLESLECVLEYGLAHRPQGSRVLADLWDIEQFATCGDCAAARVARLATMNQTQRPVAAVQCRCTPAE